MQRMHRTVYLMGAAPPTPVARARAGVLAVGDGAVLSHRTASELFGLLPDVGGDVDVTMVGRNPGVHPGIRVHRPRALALVDVTTVHGMPVTSIARSICDLAATESRDDVMRAFQEALYRRVVTPRALAAVLAREPKRKGARVVRSLIRDPRLTRSERERLLLKLIDQAQLPRPLTNVRTQGIPVDVLWPVEKLIVEFDGWGAHGHRLAWQARPDTGGRRIPRHPRIRPPAPGRAARGDRTHRAGAPRVARTTRTRPRWPGSRTPPPARSPRTPWPRRPP